MEELVLFGLCYVLVFVLYQIFIVSKAKKNYEKEDKKYPVEVKYLIGKYKLDMEKIKYNQLLQIVALVSSFDISLMVSAVSIFDNYVIQLVAAVAIVIPVLLVSYSLVGLFYKKKGMVKDV